MLPADKKSLVAFTLAFAGTLVAANFGLEAWVGRKPPVFKQHKENVITLPNDPLGTPPATEGPPEILLVANSHAYSLPGQNKGDPYREDTGVTLLDLLGAHVDDQLGSGQVRYLRLAYPNYLPIEMFVSLSRLFDLGYRPKVVVIGWAWANVARDRGVRSRIQRAFRTPGFSESLIARVSRPGVDAPPELLDELRAVQAKVDLQLEEERGRSQADQLENEVQDWADEQIAALGRSREIRAKVFRNMVMPIQDQYAAREAAYLYDAIPPDLEFNRKLMLALIRWLHAEGIYVFTYFTPQRPNQSPLVDPAREAETMAEYIREAERLGFATVDARSIIPDGDNVWGWAGDFQDRSHFMEPGHQILAEFLAKTGEASGVWERAIRTDVVGVARP